MFRQSLLALGLTTALMAPTMAAMTQDQLDTIANDLDLQYDVLDNTQDAWRTFRARITLTNQSAEMLANSDWTIFFSHIRMIPEQDLPGVKISHINGDMFKLEPTESFTPLHQGDSLDIEFDAEFWQAAKTDVMPNWYIVGVDAGGNELEARLIVSTSNVTTDGIPVLPDDELAFVGDFNSAMQWKRYDDPEIVDRYDPPTATSRYEANAIINKRDVRGEILPTPAQAHIRTDRPVSLDDSWTIVYAPQVEQEALLLAQELGLNAAPSHRQLNRANKRIRIRLGKVNLGQERLTTEAYKLHVAKNQITIRGSDAAGVFYGIQSLLALRDGNTVYKAKIIDAPRYGFRGMHVDVARNFQSKKTVLSLIDEMARLKLNRLHLHLTDDEGWRLEIPGLPELTDVGAQRCHDETESRCLLPFLGAGVAGISNGSGFYTVADYRQILQYANERHIEVIPEFDLPGHAHAAIKAMEARQKNLLANGASETDANAFLLSDPNDQTEYLSVQMFTDNAINVCQPSSYRFIDHVIAQTVAMHSDIQPLNTFHFGGDEVAGAWTDSPICQAFIAEDNGVDSIEDLSPYFVRQVATIADSHGLNLAGWEDGLLGADGPYPRVDLPNPQVYANAWQNVWEWGVADRAYNLANNGYEVVMSQATHLYFDHPYEADPAERGYYWAPRFTDTRKVFGFMPDDLYANADFKRNGDPISPAEVKEAATVKELLEPQNIIGMQGHLWSETVRSAGQFQGMVFPRMLALAERAWYRADWEADTLVNLGIDTLGRDDEFNRFANILGQKWLPQLEARGVSFRLPVPGGQIVNGVLQTNSVFPGLGIQYATNDSDWQDYDPTNPPSVAGVVFIRTISGERASRVTTLVE